METNDIQGEWCAHGQSPSHFMPIVEGCLTQPICGAELTHITMTCFRPPVPNPCPLCVQIVERENEPEGVLIRLALGTTRVCSPPDIEKLASYVVKRDHAHNENLRSIRQRLERMMREPYPD